MPVTAPSRFERAAGPAGLTLRGGRLRARFPRAGSAPRGFQPAPDPVGLTFREIGGQVRALSPGLAARAGFKPAPLARAVTCPWPSRGDSNPGLHVRSVALFIPLRYATLATCRGFDPRSSARHADRHTSSVAGREMVSAGRLERPLSALSTRSLCRLGYADEIASWSTDAFLDEDWCSVHGFEPATCPLQGGCSAN